jgi:hypothetical protein
MAKSAKQTSGGSVKISSVVLHSTPTSAMTKVSQNETTDNKVNIASPAAVTNQTAKVESSLPSVKNSPLAVAVTEKKIVQSLKVPTLLLKQPVVESIHDSSDREISTPSTQSAKLYTIHTGMPETEPVIVLSSEFVPLYDGGQKSYEGKSISLKESAKIVNAKSAISVLLQSDDTKSAIQENKKTLLDFINSEGELVSNLLTEMSKAVSSLDVGTYKLSSYTDPTYISSLQDILKKGGYSTFNIDKFSDTKLWQQSLVELKRSLLSHSPDLTSDRFTRKNVKNDEDPYTLSDLDDPPEGLKRFWINPYYNQLPAVDSLSDGDTTSYVKKLSQFTTNQYVNLIHANPPVKLLRSSNMQNVRNASVLNAGGLKNSRQPLVLPHDALVPYESSGRDISIIANALFKEASYSSFILNQNNKSILSSKFGYDISKTGDNFQVWDYVVGRFPDSVLNVVKSPSGNGSSLVSLSQDDIVQGKDTYHVLTFENNFLEDSNSTPGVYYFIESTLSTADGKTFDTSRLDSLILKVNSAYSTTQMMYDMLGYDVSTAQFGQFGSDETYVKRSVTDELSLEGLTDRISHVTKVYHKSLRRNSDRIEGIDTSVLRSGLTTYESIGVRLASLLCKAAVSPTDAFKNSAVRIKTMLFLWLINVVLQQTEDVGNSKTTRQIRDMLATELSSLIDKVSKEAIDQATSEGRTFTVVVNNSSDADTEDTKDNLEKIFLESQQDFMDINQIASHSKREATNVIARMISDKIFYVDTGSRGLWSAIVGLLKDVYENKNIYENDVTGYSGMSKTAYIFSYFDLILRVVAAQTPENLIGLYKTKAEVLAADGSSSTLNEIGFVVDKVDQTQLNEHYDVTHARYGHSDAKLLVRKLSDSLKFTKSEEDAVVRKISVFRKFLANLNTNLMSFRSYLTKNFETYLTTAASLYTLDKDLDSKQKNALLNLSLSEEQMRLSRYVMSEVSDRVSESDSSAKLKSTAWFKSFPDGFEDFMSLDETDLISYSMLSPFFSSRQFLKKKGGNKKIISVGIPPRLNRKIHTSAMLSFDNTKGIKQGLVKLRVYKIDRLHPDIVYLPKTFLFDMNRFPTRVLGNWDYDAFARNSTNVLNIPSKLIAPNNEVYVHRNFSSAFPDNLYGNLLLPAEKLQIYGNHSISFLLEEYLRWFTDCRFSESRYHHFSPLSKTLTDVEDQYNAYIKNVVKQSVPIPDNNTASNKRQIHVEHTDPSTGKRFLVPFKNFGGIFAGVNIGQKSSSQASVEQVKKGTADKPYIVPMDDSVRTFFMNETLLTDPNVFYRRMLYPKKFDRVFNLVVDPDDFYVDESMSEKSTLESLVSLGVLTGGDQGSSSKDHRYKHRDTSLDDVTLDEYFVTIEPYDYVQGKEV